MNPTSFDNKQKLLDPNLEAFKDVVFKDVRNESSIEEVQYLSENIDYWIYFLQITKRDVEFQLASQKSRDKLTAKEMANNNTDPKEIDSYLQRQEKWRMGALRFLSAIEKRMLYAKILFKHQQQQAAVATE
jgi:hypothetical protein